MNISEFERLLREGNTPQHFPPQEDKWLKLEEALIKKRRGGIFVLPKRIYWMAAASIALLISFGLYTLYSPQSGAPADVVQTPLVTDPLNQTQPVLLADTPVNAVRPAIPLPVYPQRDPRVASGKQKDVQPPVDSLPLDSIVVANAPEEHQPQPAEKKRVLPYPGDLLPFDDGDQYARTPTSKLDFGFSAFYGFSALSKAQYRLSVDAKRNISKRVFANVQFVAAAAKLSTSTTYQYQVVSLGPSGITPEVSTQETQAVYSGNVYTLGLTPSIGFRLTKSLSLSAGPDLQKALSNSIQLTSKEEFRNQINNQTLVEDRQYVAGFDLGIQSAARISVSRHLAFGLLYRHGLTGYLKKTSGTTRNSFMSIGLSYSFK